MALYRGPIVDAHHHLWDLSGGAYPWLGVERRPEMVFGATAPLVRDYLLDDYLADTAGQDVVKSVHVEAGYDPARGWEETRWLQSVADRHGYPQGIVAGAPLRDPDLRAILARHRAHPNLRGVRAIASWHDDPRFRFVDRADLMDDPAWRRGLAILRDHGLSLDLMVNGGQLGDVGRLAAAYPDLTIIVNHAGSPVDRDAAGLTKWRAGLAQIAAEPNVAIKLSDLAAYDHDWTVESYRPIVQSILDAFGPARCMFGSDFPVAGLHGSFARHFDAFREIVSELPPATQRGLFHDNATRLYRL